MNVQKRTEKLKVIREKGFVPGTIYGKGFPAQSIQIEEKDIVKLVNKYSTSMTFSVKLDGETHIVYIKEYQKTFKSRLAFAHFDFVKVSATDTLQSKVSVHLIGKEVFDKSSMMVSLTLEELDIEYNVGSGVSQLDVDVSELTFEQPLFVKDVVVPKGVKILNDLEDMVVHLVESKSEVEPEESDEQDQIEEVSEEAEE